MMRVNDIYITAYIGPDITLLFINFKNKIYVIHTFNSSVSIKITSNSLQYLSD